MQIGAGRSTDGTAGQTAVAASKRADVGESPTTEGQCRPSAAHVQGEKRKPGAAPSEATYTQALVGRLRRRPGVWALKVHGGPYQRRGVPDIIGCSHGQFFALEVKDSKHGKTTPQQDVELGALVLANARARVVFTHEPIEEVLAWVSSES